MLGQRRVKRGQDRANDQPDRHTDEDERHHRQVKRNQLALALRLVGGVVRHGDQCTRTAAELVPATVGVRAPS